MYFIHFHLATLATPYTERKGMLCCLYARVILEATQFKENPSLGLQLHTGVKGQIN